MLMIKVLDISAIIFENLNSSHWLNLKLPITYILHYITLKND